MLLIGLSFIKNALRIVSISLPCFAAVAKRLERRIKLALKRRHEE